MYGKIQFTIKEGSKHVFSCNLSNEVNTSYFTYPRGTKYYNNPFPPSKQILLSTPIPTSLLLCGVNNTCSRQYIQVSTLT